MTIVYIILIVILSIWLILTLISRSEWYRKWEERCQQELKPEDEEKVRGMLIDGAKSCTVQVITGSLGLSALMKAVWRNESTQKIILAIVIIAIIAYGIWYIIRLIDRRINGPEMKYENMFGDKSD